MANHAGGTGRLRATTRHYEIPGGEDGVAIETFGVSLILPVCVSCALFRERPVETAPTIVLPEVRKITFTGNTQFSSRTLIGEMVSKPRPSAAVLEAR